MTTHFYGDNFDFDGLEKAGRWIATFYYRRTHKRIMWKEKYGTIRYEFTYLWCLDSRHTFILCEILRRATLKFPDIAAELVDDLVTRLSSSDNPVMSYYCGYFQGIARGWWPKTRPYTPYKKDDDNKYS